jgi:hypothetical protein
MKVLEEMKAKADNANKEHETAHKKLEDDLAAMRRLKVVVYFIHGVHASDAFFLQDAGDEAHTQVLKTKDEEHTQALKTKDDAMKTKEEEHAQALKTKDDALAALDQTLRQAQSAGGVSAGGVSQGSSMVTMRFFAFAFTGPTIRRDVMANKIKKVEVGVLDGETKYCSLELFHGRLYCNLMNVVVGGYNQLVDRASRISPVQLDGFPIILSQRRYDESPIGRQAQQDRMLKPATYATWTNPSPRRTQPSY